MVPQSQLHTDASSDVKLVDMHCHLGFATNGSALVNWAEHAGALLFSNSVTPDDWANQQQTFGKSSAVVVGFGMHPWWVDASWNAKSVVDLLDQKQPYALGEIGMDFGAKHQQNAQQQIEMFSAIVKWAAQTPGRLLSIHAVKAVDEVLDILEKSGTLNTCVCIFHWFNGSSDQLQRAIKAGCYFSVGAPLLNTKKGREYTKAIPTDRLLIESDLPSQPNTNIQSKQLHEVLKTTADEVAALKGADCLPAIMKQATTLLKLGGRCV